METRHTNVKARDKLVEHASRLRFPWLLGATVVLFVADLVIPDIVPFVDEVLLGLFSLVLASLRRRKVSGRATGQSDPPAQE